MSPYHCAGLVPSFPQRICPYLFEVNGMAMVAVTNTERVHGVTRTAEVSASDYIGADVRLIAGAIVSVVAAAILMWFAYRYWIKPTTMQVMTGFVPYAGVLAVTAALERFLEPLSDLIPPQTGVAKDAATEAKTVMRKLAADFKVRTQVVQQHAQDAATKQAQVDKEKFERTIIFWAIASVCGLAISGGFGMFLLQSISTSHVNSFLDLTVTGLTIGAGTKPLHDAIVGIQKTTAAK